MSSIKEQGIRAGVSLYQQMLPQADSPNAANAANAANDQTLLGFLTKAYELLQEFAGYLNTTRVINTSLIGFNPLDYPRQVNARRALEYELPVTQPADPGEGSSGKRPWGPGPAGQCNAKSQKHDAAPNWTEEARILQNLIQLEAVTGTLQAPRHEMEQKRRRRHLF